MKIFEKLILERIKTANDIKDTYELIQKDFSDRSRTFEMRDSKNFSLKKFRVKLLKTQYSNEFIEECKLNSDRILILHLRREYLNNRFYSVVIEFIKRENKNLLIFIELINEIVYDDYGNEYFI